jgi:glyoxylase I family protein
MMFKRIDHVEIVTDQLDRTVQFYTEVLGFAVKARDRIERSGLGVPIDLVYLDLGGTVVELISYEGGAVDPAPQSEHLGYRMMALEVDDMEKTADYLRTKGVDIVWGPRVREAYLKSGDLRPKRLPYRTQAVVPVSRCVRDRRTVEGASKIIY